jgi:hypothetical protein
MLAFSILPSRTTATVTKTRTTAMAVARLRAVTPWHAAPKLAALKTAASTRLLKRAAQTRVKVKLSTRRKTLGGSLSSGAQSLQPFRAAVHHGLTHERMPRFGEA